MTITAGCGETKQKPVEKKMEVMIPINDTSANNLAALEFASKKDLSCGMPISSGITDTANYKGKLYGFCSAECKADFLKNAKALLKAK